MNYCKFILIVALFIPVYSYGKKAPLTYRKLGKVSANPVSVNRAVNYAFYGTNFNLCGPNQQLGGNTWVYSTECCKKNEDKQCIEEKQCRRAKADCVQRDNNGEVVAIYESYGVKDCGSCNQIADENIAITITPY